MLNASMKKNYNKEKMRKMPSACSTVYEKKVTMKKCNPRWISYCRVREKMKLSPKKDDFE